MKLKVDLHTHSILSYDGIMNVDDYRRILSEGLLDYVAITDHNEIDMAKEIQKELGDKIIVGEEIKTDAGDLIGLFMTDKIPKGTSLYETVHLIKEQKGIVYVPHPFDFIRSGLDEKHLKQILKNVDIIEGFNARLIIPGGNKKSLKFAARAGKPVAAGSDSHGFSEIGRTYNIVNEIPTQRNLVSLIQNAEYSKSYVQPWNFLNPKKNKLTKYFKKNGKSAS